MNRIILIAAALLIGTFAFAQDEDRSKEREEKRHERMEAQRIAYITSELDLTAKEAQRFWPVYNEYHDAKKALHPERSRDRKEKEDLETLTNAQASQKVQEHLQRQEQELLLRKKYFAKLDGVLSPKKQLKLMKIDGKFRKDILKKYKKRIKGKAKRWEKNREGEGK